MRHATKTGSKTWIEQETGQFWKEEMRKGNANDAMGSVWRKRVRKMDVLGKNYWGAPRTLPGATPKLNPVLVEDVVGRKQNVAPERGRNHFEVVKRVNRYNSEDEGSGGNGQDSGHEGGSLKGGKGAKGSKSAKGDGEGKGKEKSGIPPT